MLNPFPELLAFSFVAPFILRIVAGLIFFDLGLLKFRGEKASWQRTFDALGLRPADFFVPVYGLIQILGGILLFVGAWTQVAAIVFAVSTAIELYIEWKAKEVLKRDFAFYLLIFAISVSLILTGAGAYAVDMPL